VRVDANGFIDQDRPCCRCGYDLRGLRPEGRCPECGTVIAATLLGPSRQLSTRAVIALVVGYRLVALLVPLLGAGAVAGIAYLAVRRLISYYALVNEAF